MAERRGYWWIVPVSLLALVLFLEQSYYLQPPAAPAAAATEAVARPGLVVLQDASGRRSQPWHPAAASAVLMLDFGVQLRQQRVSVTLWQLQADGTRQQPAWLALEPRLRRDGTVPIAGLPAGSYDVEVEVGRGGPGAWRAGATAALVAGALQRVAIAPAAAPGR